MKRKPFWAIISLIVIAGFILTACGGPATTEAPQATEAPVVATEAPAGDVALRWRTRPDNQEEIDVYSQVSSDIDAQLDGVTLTYEPGGSESASYQDVLKTEIAAGTAPDVFWIPGTDVADFASRGLILNINDLATAASGFNVGDFYPGPMYHLTYNIDTGQTGGDSGALWGLPRDVSTFALYLNMDLINEAGAPDPRELAKEGKWDWNAFLDVARSVRGIGADIYGYGANAWWGPDGVWMNSAGGGFFNADRTACNLNAAGSLQGLTFQQSLYQTYDVAVPYGEDSEPPFRAGKVAMFQNGRWATPGIRTVDFNWDVVELPKGPQGIAGNWLFWGAYVVNAKTEHPEEAWKLVQELTTAETQGKISALGANIPSRVSDEALDAFLTFAPPDNNQAFLNGIADDNGPVAEGPLWAGSWPEFSAIMGPAVQAVMTGDKTVNDFAATICDEAGKAFQNPAAVAPADVVVRWRTRPDNQEEINVYSQVSADVDEQLDGVTLAYEPGGSETASYQDVLKTEIAAGTAPDVFWIPGTDVADFATRGLILNINDLATAASGFNVGDFYPGPMFHLTYNPETSAAGAESGALWGLPRDVSTFGLYLNLDLLAEAGFTGDKDPRELAKNGQWDWEAFLEVAQGTRALGSDIYGYGANAWWGPDGVWMNSAGGGFFNADRTACNLNAAGSLQGLTFQQSLYQTYDVAVPYGEDSEPPFRAGKVAMFQNGRWATPGIRTVDFNWDVVELPKGPQGIAGNWLFWGAYVINANTQNPEAAWQLIQALTTAETQGKISALGANIPSRVSDEALDAFLTFAPPDNNQAFLNGIADDNGPVAEGPLWAGSWPEFSAIMGPAVQAVMTGDKTVAEFGATICDEAGKSFNP